jgi:Zn-dependent peptidase ImmA (M78 family)
LAHEIGHHVWGDNEKRVKSMLDISNNWSHEDHGKREEFCDAFGTFFMKPERGFTNQ